MRKIAFEPIVNKKSRILILGTMPSEESLRKKERYGHKSNQFWKIIFTLFQKPLPEDYKEKNALLIENNIAIWDVLESCEGKGSLDTNIRNEKPNNFEKFYKKHPQIKHIFFTSKKAEEFYRRYVGFDENRTFITLPSPSPANATMKLSEKIEKWKILLEVVKSYSEP
ncbi:DNA-deoxyinosine glycosylase [Dysgonomonas sp. Marseille-P4677]|uniref:DNA-deoxyinosine glycosylase n=1 Tax=Dysgonomonas sp. Marseille-P4677 TaxID=2364790 RepID=UPI00191363A1|nr:DNA-deoxyinosine glycosylase [Dysgonomonas sp. Marseille-P4677]MBK5720768.1 DNA-deoxyinosine glycosylase [Dysgonomonas sp. Marseille-P4677]